MYRGRGCPGVRVREEGWEGKREERRKGGGEGGGGERWGRKEGSGGGGRKGKGSASLSLTLGSLSLHLLFPVLEFLSHSPSPHSQLLFKLQAPFPALLSRTGRPLSYIKPSEKLHLDLPISHLHGLELGNRFFTMTHSAQAAKENINELGLNQNLKLGCSKKDTIGRVKRKPSEWEKV